MSIYFETDDEIGVELGRMFIKNMKIFGSDRSISLWR
jgi:hypothetical protein